MGKRHDFQHVHRRKNRPIVYQDSFSGNKFTNKEIIEKFHIGGARYQGGTSEEVQNLINDLQSYSKIPLLSS